MPKEEPARKLAALFSRKAQRGKTEASEEAPSCPDQGGEWCRTSPYPGKGAVAQDEGNATSHLTDALGSENQRSSGACALGAGGAGKERKVKAEAPEQGRAERGTGAVSSCRSRPGRLPSGIGMRPGLALLAGSSAGLGARSRRCVPGRR